MSLRPVDPALLVQGADEDPRLGRRVQPDVDRADVILLGCADDTGVANSGGRTGAALGPTEIRRWLYKQTTGMAGELERIEITDLGDVMPGATIEETHAEVERVVSMAAKTGATIVFLGGGHDLAYPSQSGVLSSRPGRAAVINVDAHLDVRPLKDGRAITSGTPFRRVLDRWGDRIASFLELATQPQHNAKAHAEYVKQKRGRIAPLEELRTSPGVIERMKREFLAVSASTDFTTVSIDLDVVRASDAPGVSAPPADGLSADELARFCDVIGRSPKVQLLDLMEHAPQYDENAKTARLAALCLWRFLAGVAAR